MSAQTSVERRIVTVLFADLVGFTALSESLDPEDVATVQDAYFALVRETIDRFGGKLEKFIGDAAMAVFGIPRARDDDAERAVRAGLALANAIEQLGARVGLEDGDLRLRVGVNTGEVAYGGSGPDDWRVSGDTVNSASRLQTAADPGTVLIGETTHLAVEEAIEVEPAGELQLKGKAQPVPAWCARGVRPIRSRDHAMGTLRAPMLGREREMSLLVEALAVASQGERRRWVVVAPPGVGKTRLIDEFARQAGNDGRAILRARCRQDVVGPYQPVAQLVAGALALAGFDPASATADLAIRREEARAFLAERIVATGVTPARAAVVADETVAVLWPEAADGSAPESAATDREARFDAWMTALDALTAPHVPVLLAEDVHWAGGDFLSFLDFAIDGEGERGRLVIATCRPSLLETAPQWIAERVQERRHLLDLPPLSPADASELVRALVGDAVPPELIERVAERSDGNPLFIEEILRTWVSVGILSARDGRWEMTETVGVHLPATLQGIYAGQIDDLPPHAREVARRASVAGRRFPIAALEPLEVADGAEGVDVLVRRALVRGPEADPFAGQTYSYRHALLRDAAYASLARADRARLHVRLARWIEAVAGERAAAVAEVIGGHYASALESAPALSADVEGLSRPDIEAFGALWFERGGETALGLAAHDAARSLFKRSLDLTAPDAALDRARRWERLGDATAYAGDMDEGGRALGESVDIYRTAMGHLGLSADARFTARDGYARALASLGWVWGQQLRFKDAAQLAEDGLRLMGEGDDIATARLLYLRARSVGLFQLQPEMREDLERALELTRRQGAATLEFEITQALHDLLIEDGKVGIDELIEHDRRVIDLARELERWQDVTRTLRMEAMMLAEERVAESWPRLDEAAEVAEAHGLREETAWIDYARAEAGFASGDWDRAWDAATRAIDIAERNAYHRAAVRTWFVLVAMALARGRRDVLEHAARWFDQYSELFPHSPYGELMHGAIDLRLAAAGIRESDGPSLDDVLAVWDETQILGSVWDASETVAQQWLARGAFEDVRTWLDAMARWHDHPMTSNLGKGAHALIEARLHLAEGRRELASTLAGRAAETFRTCPAPWWLAKAIRLLEAAGTASPSLTTEGAQIEQALGVTAGRP